MGDLGIGLSILKGFNLSWMRPYYAKIYFMANFHVVLGIKTVSKIIYQDRDNSINKESQESCRVTVGEKRKNFVRAFVIFDSCVSYLELILKRQILFSSLL